MCKVLNTKQMFEKFKEDQILLNKQCYVEEGYLILNVRYEYDIALERCDTHEKVLDWVLHLAGKNWFSMELMRKFITVANEEIKKRQINQQL